MVRLILAFVFLFPFLLLAQVPRVNPQHKQENWNAGPGDGSCTHATLVTLFYAQGRPDLGQWWFKNHGGGESCESINQQLAAAKIPYAYTERRGDVGFLRWAVKEGLGCGVAIGGNCWCPKCRGAYVERAHMIAVVDITDTHICLLDNNRVTRYYWVELKRFLEDWNASGSWAVTPVVKVVSSRPPVMR